jgi:DNA-binding winged helix-turn-helix (wHTH) protein/Tol biopolymer transport system component
MSLESKHQQVIHFGVFQLDLRAGELRKSGVKLKLQEQPFRVLCLLLERPGELISREELRNRLWPADTFVDFDHGLNAAVKRLREALGESADNPLFIETLARRGYRFIAPTDGSENEAETSNFAPKEDRKSRARRWWLLGVSVVALSAALVWAVRVSLTRPSQSSQPTIAERKLTANSTENPIDGAAISPDGSYLAYSDATGLYLKLIRSGEVHRIGVPGGFSGHVEGWLPDGAHVLVSRAERPEGTLALWNVPIVGGAPRKIIDDGWGASVSPDGTRIAFLRGAPAFNLLAYRKELWIARLDGSDAREVTPSKSDEVFAAPAWSRDGVHLAYIRVHQGNDYSMIVNSVELKDMQSVQSRVLFSGTGFGDSLCWLSDGRLVYNLQEELNPADSNLWALQVRESPRNSPGPVRLTRGTGWATNIRATANGNTLEFLRKSRKNQVLVAGLASDGKQLLSVRRLTLDENNNIPFSWTPDSKAIIFTSDRNGTFDLFTHALDQPLPEPLVTGSENKFVARLNPEGTELLYQSMAATEAIDAPRSIFAIPLAGGAPRLVLREKYITNLQCARLPSTLCAYSVNTSGKELIRKFDPKTGESSPLAEFPTQGMPTGWSLSPNGSLLAMARYHPDQAIIHLRSMSDNTNRDLIVKGRVGLATADWAADGNSFFATSMDRERKSTLFNLRLDGSTYLLMKDDKDFVDSIEWAVPSPDGKLLAISKFTGIANAWSLTNF